MKTTIRKFTNKNGKEYKLVQCPNKSLYCTGCAFENDIKSCQNSDNCVTKDEPDGNFVWKEIK